MTKLNRTSPKTDLTRYCTHENKRKDSTRTDARCRYFTPRKYRAKDMDLTKNNKCQTKELCFTKAKNATCLTKARKRLNVVASPM
jgi:hypothetical protein